MKFKAAIAVIFLLITVSPVFAEKTLSSGRTLGEGCPLYAKAIYAIAEARDNLDEPSWNQLLELHPILKEIEETKGSGFLYAKMINLKVINKDVSPMQLRNDAYERCKTPKDEDNYGPCILWGKFCKDKK